MPVKSSGSYANILEFSILLILVALTLKVKENPHKITANVQIIYLKILLFD